MANELQVEVDHSSDFKLKRRERKTERELAKVYVHLELSSSNSIHAHLCKYFSSRTRIQLTSFLLGAKPKKQPLIACLNTEMTSLNG